MAIRITGMYSGLDTESIISELASAQSAKKNSLVKAQTKLSWKQDAWKALNTKIYSFYTNVLTGMNLQGSYQKKTTKVSNDKYVNVVTSNSSVNGVQNMKIDKMAKAGYLTGGVLQGADGKKLSANSTLKDLGFSGDGSFSVTVGGKSTTIKVGEDTKIADVVSQLQAAGVNANFDEKNQRMFVSSKNTGELANFTLTGGDANGMQALSALGLITEKDLLSDEYTKWAAYKDAAGVETQAYLDLIDAEIAKRANAYKAQNDSLTKANAELQAKLDKVKNDPGFPSESAAALYDRLYGSEHDKLDENGHKIQKKDADGNPVVDEHGAPVYEQVRDGGIKANLDSKKEALKTAQDALAEAKKNGGDVAAAQQAVDQANSALTVVQAEFNEVNGKYSMAKAAEDYQKQIDKNNATINDNKKYFTETTVDGKTTVEGTADLETAIRTEFDKKVETAQDVVNGAYSGLVSSTATRIIGEDAKIYLNGAEFTSDTNNFEVNGLTISVMGETDEEITLSTSEDVDGMYDMIKNFIVEYNKLINEMDSLYNAASSKGYEPLLTEEKDALTDTEVEEWEKKIKDSLLRRDSTLSGVSGAMKTVMMQGVEVNGKRMYLADFGIETMGYFKSADNEKNAYHINGDEDETDSNIRGKDNDLKSMIASDPDTVMQFFSGLSKNLYAELDKKMARSESSSAFTVYNDKDMKEEYDSYKEKISKQETKLNDLIDKWYKKFSVMETAMAKLQSKNNAVAGMFGG